MPALSGVLLTLVAQAGASMQVDNCYDFGNTYDMNVPQVQVAFVFYDKSHLDQFLRRAETAESIRDWECGNGNFVVSNHTPPTCAFCFVFHSLSRGS